MGQVPSHLPHCVCVSQNCDLAGEDNFDDLVAVRPAVDMSELVDPHAERTDLELRNTGTQRQEHRLHAGKTEFVTQIVDFSQAHHQSSSESTATARSMESDLTERTLSEWYSTKSEGDFVEVAPANLQIASKGDYENFKKFKSLSKWLADGHPQPSCESDTTENYFVYDPSKPDS